MKKKTIKSSDDRSLGNSFGLVLRQLRQNRGLSQEQLGFESGYHRTYISLLERGQKSPSLQTIFKLAEVLKVEPSEIIERIQALQSQLKSHGAGSSLV
jgi:transcriptional regulator with XRE-family HTH domain